MPFNIQELVTMSSILRNVVIGVTGIIYPECQVSLGGHYFVAMRSVGARSAVIHSDEIYPQHKWIQLLKVIPGVHF